MPWPAGRRPPAFQCRVGVKGRAHVLAEMSQVLRPTLACLQVYSIRRVENTKRKHGTCISHRLSPPYSLGHTGCRLGCSRTVRSKHKNHPPLHLPQVNASLTAQDPEDRPPDSTPVMPSQDHPLGAAQTLPGGRDAGPPGTWEGAARRGGHQAVLECVQATGRSAAGDHRGGGAGGNTPFRSTGPAHKDRTSLPRGQGRRPWQHRGPGWGPARLQQRTHQNLWFAQPSSGTQALVLLEPGLQ